MEKRCPSCEHINSIIARSCERCNQKFGSGGVGGEIREVSSVIRPSPKDIPISADGERKTVTALFVDIQSSVELMENMDAEDAQSIVDPALQIMLDAVLFYDGYVVHTLGDGLFAMFGAPIAFEDHARRATYAAIEIQRALKAYDQRLVRQGRPGLQARIGINTGEAVLRALDTGGRLEYNSIGHAINLAARLQSVARSGSILISGSTSKYIDGYFELKSVGPITIRGIREAVVAFEVLGLGTLRRNLQVSMTKDFIRFVGRESEMNGMQRALALAMSGKGQFVVNISEAGAGKSRLLFEFARSLPPECLILEAYALPHTKEVPWLPVVDMLMSYFDIRGDDSVETRRQKVLAALEELDASLIDASTYLYELLGMREIGDPLREVHPSIKRARMLDAIKNIILIESNERPLVFIFEDAHWADAQSRMLLDLLVDSISDTRILLIASCRPDIKNAWRNRGNYVEIALKPFTAAQADQLLSALLHEMRIAPHLRAYIIGRADGNPFFLQEIVRSLRDGRFLTEEAESVTSVGELRVPATVQATLAARVDGLTPDLKGLLQALSVVGSRLPLSLLTSLTGIEPSQLQEMLLKLQNADFIYAQTTHDQTVYAFRHVLTQEVTYQSLLSNRRKKLHAAVGRAIETVYASSLGDHTSELAYHFSRSNSVSKAVEYLGRLGELESQRSAHVEAADSIRAALSVITSLPDDANRWAQESRLWLALGVSLQASLGYAAPEVAEAYEKSTAISERTGDVPLLVSATTGQSIFSIVRADYKTAFRLAERLSALDDPIEQYSLEWLMLFGLASAYTGKHKDAQRYFLKALAIRQSAEIVEPIQLFGQSRASCLSYLAVTMFYLGYPDAAFRYSEEAIALAEELKIPIAVVQSQGMHGLLCHTALEFERAEEWIDKAVAGAAAGGFPYWQMLGSLMKSSILVEAGQTELGLSQFNQLYLAYQQSGAQIGLPWLLTLRGQMQAKAGQDDAALLAFDEALACIQKTDERYHEAEVLRLKGVLFSLQNQIGSAERAETCFIESLRLARERQTKTLELRAAVNLAKFYCDRDRRDEGVKVLFPICEWFDDESTFKEFRTANELLGKLSSGPG